MPEPKVKICGITTYEDAKAALDAGADALGFNFIAASRRVVSPEGARSIISRIGTEVWNVGVFLDHESPQVRKIATFVGLDTLQFHGSESPGYCQSFVDFRLIKAFPICSQADAQMIEPYRALPIFFLLDAAVAGEAGGTGKEIPESVLQAFLARDIFPRAFLAGGLSAQNVSQKVRAFQPFGVDVASGVESVPGKKDRVKIEAFVRAGKATSVEHGVFQKY